MREHVVWLRLRAFEASAVLMKGRSLRHRVGFLRVLLALVLLFSIFSSGASAGLNAWTTNGPEGGNTWALAIDPTTPATLYAGTGGGVFKSTNGSGSWSAINTGLTNINVQALAIDPASPATL